MVDEFMMDEQKILITGATGFIGGRLTERLILDGQKKRLRIFVRDLTRIARIARFGELEYVHGDILDSDRVNEAAAGCNVIFHCAYGNRGDSIYQKKVTVEGTKNVCEAALRNSSRLIYLSTVSVYGNDPPVSVDETTPSGTSKVLYDMSKRKAEKIVGEYVSKHSLNAITLRPTIVYGPFSPVWAINPISQLKEKCLILIDEGRGLCNYLYVDNLVDAMLLAARTERTGGSYIISDGSPVPWREFYGYYKRMLDDQGVENAWLSVDRVELERLNKQRMNLVYNLKGLVKTAISNESFNKALLPYGLITNVKSFIKEKLPQKAIKTFRSVRTSHIKESQEDQSAQVAIEPPRPEDIIKFSSKSVFSIEKAQKELGFTPRVDLEEGMRRIAQWHAALF
ncbi:MAG TPA: NAD-dependent epimerase/dehydratase family protein [Syntrophorhabdus sp.]|nr:NAD-dependent epimerase/dehydratase family protein [Syntrophorhabdus sp.]